MPVTTVSIMKDNVVNEATFSITNGYQKLNEYNDQPDTETMNAQSLADEP